MKTEEDFQGFYSCEPAIEGKAAPPPHPLQDPYIPMRGEGTGLDSVIFSHIHDPLKGKVPTLREKMPNMDQLIFPDGQMPTSPHSATKSNGGETRGGQEDMVWIGITLP